MTEENLKIIKTEAQKLLEYLMVEATIEVSEKEDVYEVQIETEDTGILIGYHGETLTSLQLILSLILYKRLGSWLRLIVNVGDWRQKREEVLKQMALSAAERVIATDEAMVLPNLSSFERRIVHLILADHPKVTSSSEGEGVERKLIIKPKE
ncbi:MAG: KH domain-containing protein [Patescibacteria group bacterium]|nr:KH domain-containing protein [Patescibacteria group bacterium]